MALVVDDVLAGAERAAPGRTAVTLRDEALTFSDLRQRSNRLANALWGSGVHRGARVAYWSDLSLEAVPLQFALGRLGAAFAPLNPAYSQDEAKAVLEYLAPRLLVVDPAHAGQAEALAHELGLPLATLGGRGPGEALDELARLASASSPIAPMPDEEDVFTIFLTSGSTGRPKGWLPLSGALRRVHRLPGVRTGMPGLRLPGVAVRGSGRSPRGARRRRRGAPRRRAPARAAELIGDHRPAHASGIPPRCGPPSTLRV